MFEILINIFFKVLLFSVLQVKAISNSMCVLIDYFCVYPFLTGLIINLNIILRKTFSGIRDIGVFQQKNLTIL